VQWRSWRSRSETPAKTQHVYETYTALAEELDANVLSERQVRDHLSSCRCRARNVNERNTEFTAAATTSTRSAWTWRRCWMSQDIDRLEGAAETLEQQAQRRYLLDSYPLILSGSDGLSTGSGNNCVWQCLLRVKDSGRSDFGNIGV